MDPKTNDELLEEYEDAMLRLMMNEYMEQEGNRILKELEEAEANGELPEVPPELDAKCRKLIADARANGRRKEMVIGFFKTAGRVAAILVVIVGFLTTLAFSVEAIRVPMVTFVVEQYEKYSAFFGIEGNPNHEKPQATITKDVAEQLLKSVLPNGFDKTYEYESSGGKFTLVYQNKNGQLLVFGVWKSDDGINIDTEMAVSKTIDIGGYEGLLVCKGADVNIYWNDPSSGYLYQLCTENMDVNDVIGIAKRFVMIRENEK